jgi:hypothetical protein
VGIAAGANSGPGKIVVGLLQIIFISAWDSRFSLRMQLHIL